MWSISIWDSRAYALCPPGLGLLRYVEIAGVMMEVIPCSLPTFDSQVTLLVTVVCAESNNWYGLLWRVMELLVPGFNPTLQISAPVLIRERVSLTFASLVRSAKQDDNYGASNIVLPCPGS